MCNDSALITVHVSQVKSSLSLAFSFMATKNTIQLYRHINIVLKSTADLLIRPDKVSFCNYTISVKKLHTMLHTAPNKNTLATIEVQKFEMYRAIAHLHHVSSIIIVKKSMCSCSASSLIIL